jgi:hypothetical protein
MRRQTSREKISVAARRSETAFPVSASSTFDPALHGRGVAKIKVGGTSGGEADIAAAKAIDPRVGGLRSTQVFSR